MTKRWRNEALFVYFFLKTSQCKISYLFFGGGEAFKGVGVCGVRVF